jgi:ribosomal protein S18 acetylase RimI-like enzyme
MQIALRTLKPEKLTQHDYSELAKLHMSYFPESLISFFGQKYAQQFYQYIGKSPFEFLLINKNQEEIIAVCVLSISPQTLSRRLILHTSLLVNIPFALYNIVSHFRTQLFMKCISSFNFYISQRREKTLTEKNSDPEIMHIFTDVKARNQGIGTLMLENCETILMNKGFNRYIIKTWDDEAKPAVKFYTQKGFILRNRFWRNGISMRMMEKVLTSTCE